MEGKDGETVHATYSVDRGMITVSEGGRTSTHRLGSMEPLARAKFIIMMGHSVVD
jgi:hypothetical protein